MSQSAAYRVDFKDIDASEWEELETFDTHSEASACIACYSADEIMRIVPVDFQTGQPIR